MDFPQVVALYSDRPQRGKTTLADMLVADLGYSRVKFAGPLKTTLGALLVQVHPGDMHPGEWVRECLEGSLKEAPIQALGDKTPRELMQTLGTRWGREMVSDSIWVDLALNRVHSILERGDGRVVIDDMRFPNEYLALAGAFEPCMTRVSLTGDNNLAGPDAIAEGLLSDCEFDLEIVADKGDVLGAKKRFLNGLMEYQKDASGPL